MNSLLTRRIGLSVLSGIGVGVLQIYDDFSDNAGGELTFYALSGFIFAAGVLFPYLKRDNRFSFRMLALVIASSASYYSAVWLAIEAPILRSYDMLSFTIASVAGAAIVMTTFVLITPARATSAFVLLGLAAGLIGGPVTFATLPDDDFMVPIGHAGWHLLICLAIYYGTGKAGRTAFIE